MATFVFDKSEIGDMLATELLKDDSLRERLTNFISSSMTNDPATIVEVVKSAIQSSDRVDGVLTTIAKEGGIENNEIKSKFIEQIELRVEDVMRDVDPDVAIKDFVRESIGDVEQAAEREVTDTIRAEMDGGSININELASEEMADYIRRHSSEFFRCGAMVESIQDAIVQLELRPYIEGKISQFLDVHLEEIVNDEVKKQLTSQNLDEIEYKVPKKVELLFGDDTEDEKIRSTIKFLSTCIPGVRVVFESGEADDRK